MKISFVILAEDGGGGPQSTKDIIHSLDLNGIKSNYYIFKCKKGIFGLMYDCWNFLLYILRHDKDGLIFNSAGLFVGALLSFIVTFLNIFGRNIKLIQIFHNRVKREDKSYIRNLFRHILFEIILLTYSKFVSVSKGIHNEITGETWFSSNNLKKHGRYIYNPTRKLENFETNPYKFDGKVILGVGRLCAQKDFSTLIEAHSLYSIIDPTCNLVIVGDGEDKKYLQSLAMNSNNPDRIHFWGYDSNIEKHYKNADVFVLSSIHEGFGLVLVEAMNSKLLTISTNCPYGPEEILDHGKFGKLVDIGDSQAICKAIHEVLSMDNSLKDLMIDLAYSRSLQFSPSVIGQEYKKLIQSL